MKNKIIVFLRSLTVSSVVIICLVCGALAVCEIYENIRFIGYGEYKNAVEITEDGIRILDFLIR
jgi:hypothetical protein